MDSPQCVGLDRSNRRRLQEIGRVTLVGMDLDIHLPAALPKQHPFRRQAIRDAVALGVLCGITLVLFAITGLYFGAYSHYRESLGLPTDNTPVIKLPVVRRH